MKVGELVTALQGHDPDLPVYFRMRAPLIGNIREVDSVALDSYSMFGYENPCVLLDMGKGEGELLDDDGR